MVKADGRSRLRTCRRNPLILGIVLAAPSTLFGQSKTIDPASEALVRELLDAMLVNDGARIRAVFAHDARQVYGDGRPKSGDAFFAWLKSDIIDQHGQVANPQLTNRGTEIVVTGQYRNKSGYSSAANFLINVRNGKIASWQMRY